MRTRRIVGWAALVVLAVAVFASPGAGQIQGPQVPPLPPIPQEATPVLEIIGPVVAAGCANAQAAVLLGLLLGGPQIDSLGVNIRPTSTSVFILCGNVPFSERSYKCASDAIIRNIADIPTKAALGLPLPADVGLLAQVIGTTYEIQDRLPPPASTAGLADQLSTTLACTQSNAPDTGGAPPSEVPTDTTPDTSSPSFDFPTDDTFVAFPLPEDLIPLVTDPSLVPDLTTVPGDVPSTPTMTAEPIGAVFRFRYPGVFALPLVMIAAAMLLGRAFTRSFDRS